MTKDTHNWEEEFDKKFMRRIGGVLMWNPERDFPHNSEIKAFIKQAYQAGIQDAIDALPEVKGHTLDPHIPKLDLIFLGWDDCREEARASLEKLLTPKE